MSAIVCGKRSIFDELSAAPSKRIRCPASSSSSSSSPVRFSPPTQPYFDPSSPLLPLPLFSSTSFSPSFLIWIRSFSREHLWNVAMTYLAIRSLNELRLGSSQNDLGSADDRCNAELDANFKVVRQGDASAQENVLVDGVEWVELFVGEMMGAANVDDAKARASRALEVLEKSIFARAQAEASWTFLKENCTLKQQVEALIQENTILKRAVPIQHERQKDYDDRTQNWRI